jgi:hypothetical protein
MPARKLPRQRQPLRLRIRIDWMGVLIAVFLGVNLLFIGFFIRQCRHSGRPVVLRPAGTAAADSAQIRTGEVTVGRTVPKIETESRQTVVSDAQTPKKSVAEHKPQAVPAKVSGSKTGGSVKSGTSVPPASVRPVVETRLQIEVMNGCGVPKIADRFMDFLRAAGFDVVKTGNYESFNVPKTLVIDRKGRRNDARRLAESLGVSRKAVIQETNDLYMVDATVVLGKDFRLLESWKTMEKKSAKK